MVTKFKIRLVGDFNNESTQHAVICPRNLHLLINQARNLLVMNFKKILIALYTFSFFQSLEMLS